MYDICLIQTPVPELQDDRLDPPYGLLSMATVLQRDGIGVNILDLSGIPEEQWQFPEASYYGFSTYTANYYRTVHIKNLVKTLYPNARTIAGGPHASALPMDVLAEFDVVVVGEGEEVIGYVIIDGSEGIIRATPVDIKKLPHVDYSLIDFSSYTRRFEDKPSFPIYTSRGCPYHCRFCSNLPNTRRVRRRDVDDVIDEIDGLKSAYGDVSFRMKDDLFASKTRWLWEFCRKVPEIQYSCNVRADFMPIVPDLLARSGCTIACMGIESGSSAILRAMGKRTTREQNLNAIKALKAVGIKVLAWIVVGYPGETWDTVKETVTLLQEAEPERVTVYPLIPYPGTPVYNDVNIIDDDFSHYFYIHGNREAGFVYETDDLPVTRIREMWEYVSRYWK